MKIIDTHCDVLWKLQVAKRGKVYGKGGVDFYHSDALEVNFKRLKEGKVMVQFFAIFIEPDVPSSEKWQHALEQIDLYYSEILRKHEEMVHIKNWGDLFTLQTGEIGAVLTLEGAEAFGNDLVKLNHLYRLGVKSIGLTWNEANLCADGIGEARGAGLTSFGRKVVQCNNEHKVLTDVSHASEQAFWDILETAHYPIASHSNARAVCDHPRNLTDEQIEALFAKDGLIQLVFYPPFIREGGGDVTVDDLVRHIDHLCSLGGVRKIGFGSDFDGINSFVKGLEHAGKYQSLIRKLLNYYTEEEVKGFAHGNFMHYARRNLLT